MTALFTDTQYISNSDDANLLKDINSIAECMGFIMADEI